MLKKLTVISILFCSFLAFSCQQKITTQNSQTKITQPKPDLPIKISQDFVQGSEDIPLLLGMEKNFEETLGFDSSSGSVASCSYNTEIDLEKIKNFYQKTLPQMGWRKVKISSDESLSKFKFSRENEKLEIEFINQNGQNLVRFFSSSSI